MLLFFSHATSKHATQDTMCSAVIATILLWYLPFYLLMLDIGNWLSNGPEKVPNNPELCDTKFKWYTFSYFTA